MGAHFWTYHVPYQDDIAAALEALRQQEFRAGRFYQPSTVQPGLIGRIFGRPHYKPKPPKTIQEAIKIGGTSAEGTRSILDMERISALPDYSAVTLVPPEELERMLGTDKPTREMVEQCEELIDTIERGHGIYLITYQQGKPNGIYFAGYSFD